MLCQKKHKRHIKLSRSPFSWVTCSIRGGNCAPRRKQTCQTSECRRQNSNAPGAVKSKIFWHPYQMNMEPQNGVPQTQMMAFWVPCESAGVNMGMGGGEARALQSRFRSMACRKLGKTSCMELGASLGGWVPGSWKTGMCWFLTARILPPQTGEERWTLRSEYQVVMHTIPCYLAGTHPPLQDFGWIPGQFAAP